MENKHNFMETEKITKLLIKFSLPAIIGMVVNALYNVVDRIYIGNIKETGHLGITGLGLVFPIIIITFSFALLIGLGGAATISLKLGEKEKDEAENYLGVAAFYALMVSFIIVLIGNLFMDKIIYLIGASEITFPYAKSYLSIIIFGTPAVILGNTLNAAIRSDGSPKMAMTTLLIGAIINIILDPIFIFYFNLGVRGAAIATIISQYISAFWTIYYFSSRLGKIKLYPKYIKFDFQKMKKISERGSSAFGIQIGFSLVTYILNKILKQYGGDISIGAMTIIQSIMAFMAMPIFGINQGTQPILGYNYGAKRFDRVREALYKAIFFASVICVTYFILIRFTAPILVNIFTDNKSLKSLAIHGLKIYTLAFPVIGFQIISSAYFLAVGKPKLSFLISLLRQIIVMIPCLIILGKIFGIMGIWYATPLADTISTLLTFILVRREIKILKKMENDLKLMEKDEKFKD